MNPEQMKHLWRLLGQMYGHKFSEQYGPVPNEAWSAALAEVPPEGAKVALQRLIGAGSPFPPTLPEFIAVARTAKTATVLRHPILDHDKPQMTPEQIAERRRQMYAALGKRIPQ